MTYFLHPPHCRGRHSSWALHGRVGGAAAHTRAVAGKCPVWAACRAAITCVHTHPRPHWSCRFSVHITCFLSCWKQLLTAAEEGVSIATFLIENADSNQPDDLGRFFQCVAFTKPLKIWVRHKNFFFMFSKETFICFLFSVLYNRWGDLSFGAAKRACL